MKQIVFDSFAMLAFFRSEKGKDEVSQLLTEIAEGRQEGFISVVNVGEIYYISHRKEGKEKAEDVLHALLHFPIEIVDADLHTTLEAARLKASYRLSYADAFVVALTKKKRGLLITGDKEFRHLEKETNFKVKII